MGDRVKPWDTQRRFIFAATVVVDPNIYACINISYKLVRYTFSVLPSTAVRSHIFKSVK